MSHRTAVQRKDNPLRGWNVDRASIRPIGTDLRRRKCILAERDGTLWSAEARGDVMRTGLNGAQSLITQNRHAGMKDDCDPLHARIYDEHIYAGTLTPDIMAATRGVIAPWILRGTTIPYFQAPVPGLPLAHWHG